MNGNGPPRKSPHQWGEQTIAPGEGRDIHLTVSESYSSSKVRVPLHVRRGREEGPTLFVTAALHGDEINGTGAIRELIREDAVDLIRGTLILIPVLNVPAFDRHSRYLPDRRDLNRSFPGSADGSLAARTAFRIFEEIVARSDFGIDLHTASVRRTNYPNVRGDLRDPLVERLALAFGCEIILNNVGPRGAFRREACLAGCPTIVMEGGEVWKVEPSVVRTSIRGVKNVLSDMNMIDDPPEKVDYQVIVEKTKWIRAERGGFLQFHVQPGEIVEKGQVLATATNLLGREWNGLEAPFHAVVIGMTTLPAVSPGEPVCHLGRLPRCYKPSRLRKLRLQELSFEENIVEDLASNVYVTDPPNDDEKGADA
jgi:predicted deacylase